MIDEVAKAAERSIPSHPDLVLLHAGTNDAADNIDIEHVGDRLRQLISRLFDAIPDVSIVASTLLPNSDPETESNIAIVNEQISSMVHSYQTQGKHITYVDFSSSHFTVSDLSDGTHPADSGYLKMAEVWYQGIEKLDDKGWLSGSAVSILRVASIEGSDNTCDKIPAASLGRFQTQMGSGDDDGPYSHVGTQVGGFAGYQNPPSVGFDNAEHEGVFWADIDGDGTEDYVYFGSESTNGIGVALGLGGGGLGGYQWFPFTPRCNRPGIRFADMIGDGRDDFCCLGPDGGLVCWQNTMSSNPLNPYWVAMGTVKQSEGFLQHQVRLADIDGDGRTDYVVFDDETKNIYGWRNGALSNGPPAYWYAMNGVFKDLPQHELSGWQFTDLNGDKKDDLVWVSKNGQVTTWINRRGFDVGIGPEWLSQGVTHQGSDHEVNVKFGRFMGSGRADYALASVKDGRVWTDRWENHDHGATTTKGDGSRYCDMTGSGSDDYIFVDASGSLTLFENQHDWGHWKEWGVIYNGTRDRQAVHLADFDGDGKCDILFVDRASGAANVMKNEYKDGDFSFTDLGVVTGGATCTQGYGTDKHDLGVRWNDLDGDGRADFLCVQTDGTVTGYLNKGVGDMVNQGLVKRSEGRERKNIRIADINGDGRDDYLYANMADGSVTAWHNEGWSPGSDEAFEWQWRSVVATGGFSRGSCVEFGNLYGAGRADYISVKPSTNEAWTWFNICPDNEEPQGSADGDPDLPTDAPPAPSVGESSQLNTKPGSSQTDSIAVIDSASSLTFTGWNTGGNMDTTAAIDVPSSTTAGPSGTASIISITDAPGSRTSIPGSISSPVVTNSPVTATDRRQPDAADTKQTSASTTTIISTSATGSQSSNMEEAPANSNPMPTSTLESTVVTSVQGPTSTTMDSIVSTNLEFEVISATDSSGSIIVGTITIGPQSSLNQASDLQTYTVFPPSVSFSSTSVESNTHDSDGYPVLGPWPLCWSCPPGSNGIILRGFPGPGIFPPAGPPPGFATPFPAITIAPNGIPSYQSSSPDPTKPSVSTNDITSTSGSRSCTTATVTRITYFVSFATDDAGSTVTTATTSTFSSTFSGCTATTITATSTAVGKQQQLCAAESCPKCIARRSVLSQTNNVRSHLGSDERSDVQSFYVGQPLHDRGIPFRGSVMAEYYEDISNNPNTKLLTNDNRNIQAGIGPGIPSSLFEPFASSDVNMRVQGLVGCTSIIVISRKGAWVSHLWEAPGFSHANAQFQHDIIDYLRNGRDPIDGVESNTAVLAMVAQNLFAGDDSTRIFIMTPALASLSFEKKSYSRDKLRESETRGNYPPRYGPGSPDPDRLTPIRQLLGQFFPSTPIELFVYRGVSEVVEYDGAYGNAMALYTNQVTEGWEETPREGPPMARWECWMQGRFMGSDEWGAALPKASSSGTSTADSFEASSPLTATQTSGFATTETSPTSTSTIVPPTTTSSTLLLSFSPTTTHSWTTLFWFSPTTTSPILETTKRPTSTDSIVYPTNTAIEKGDAYCYKPSDGKYERYSRDDANEVVSTFCAKKAVLIPENTVGIMSSVTVNAKRGILVFTKVEWAEDQSGCEPKAQFAFDDRPGTGCYLAFDIGYFCNVREPLSHGGGYVLNTPANGCIVFKQWASYLPNPEIPANARFPLLGNKTHHILEFITFPEDGETPYGPFNRTIAAAVPHLFNVSNSGNL